MKMYYSRSFATRRQHAFTIIEIALCLGIIGFALIAILGVLPFGLNVQKENRQETIINQDATVWMNAIRGGGQGYDDLTNYVLAITNIIYTYNGTNFIPPAESNIYTSTEWILNGVPQNPPLALSNGLHIIGLLSRPTWDFDHTHSNYLVASVRAISGSAVNNAPQNNQTILDDAFSYRMIMENESYVPADTNAFCLDCSATNGLSVAEMSARTNLARLNWNLETNTHSVRITFRWPFLPNGDLGNGRATFRVIAGGQLAQTNSPFVSAPVPLFFFQPTTYSTNRATPL